MTLQVRVDGWPFIVEGPGQVEIERGWDGEMVMVRGDGPVVVRLDQETLDEERSVIAEVERRMREWDRGFVELWNQLIEKQEAWR